MAKNEKTVDSRSEVSLLATGDTVWEEVPGCVKDVVEFEEARGRTTVPDSFSVAGGGITPAELYVASLSEAITNRFMGQVA